MACIDGSIVMDHGCQRVVVGLFRWGWLLVTEELGEVDFPLESDWRVQFDSRFGFFIKLEPFDLDNQNFRESHQGSPAEMGALLQADGALEVMDNFLTEASFDHFH